MKNVTAFDRIKALGLDGDPEWQEIAKNVNDANELFYGNKNQTETETKMTTETKKAIWFSRHPMPTEFDKYVEIVIQKEILFPTEYLDCCDVIDELAGEFDYILGVFPSQTIEVIANRFNGTGRFWSAVTEPVLEVDGSKTRQFKFVRWACVSG
jgi:hypothetical protein